MKAIYDNSRISDVFGDGIYIDDKIEVEILSYGSDFWSTYAICRMKNKIKRISIDKLTIISDDTK